MSLRPNIQRVLVPPATVVVPSPLFSSSTTNTHPWSVSDRLASITHPQQCIEKKAKYAATLPTQHHVCLHPVQPLVAFIMEVTTTTTTNITNQVITVQNTATQQIVWTWHWLDLAATVYAETDPQKLSVAANSLGKIQSLHFIDASVLHWSRLGSTNNNNCSSSSTINGSGATTTNTTTTTTTINPIRWQALAVQTDRRILLLNLLQGPAYTHCLSTIPTTSPKTSFYKRILAHLCEKTIGGIPSSNALPITDQWLLVGCSDGSIKCFDWRHGVMLKKIKGLGKGDCIVQLLPANPYSSNEGGTITSSSSNTTSTTTGGRSSTLKRILTVTKKGSVYLIELVLSENSIDIQVPLARFQAGTTTSVTNTNTNTNTTAVNEGTTMTDRLYPRITYDGHTDKVFWTLYNNNIPTDPVVYVWNIKSLQTDFVKNRDNTKSMFKPDASMIVQLATSGTSDPIYNNNNNADFNLHNATSVSVGMVHPALGEETVGLVSVTATGDITLYGAATLPTNTIITVQATPIVSTLSLKQLLVESISSLEEADVRMADLRVHGVLSRQLGCSEVVIVTNWGLIVLGLPILSTPQTARHIHFGAGLGSLGKSCLLVQHSAVKYASLDVMQANPVGLLELRNPVTLYESPLANHMPIEFTARPFRLAPILLQSPSGVYICIFWPTEYRYEILHTASLLQVVGQSPNSTAFAMKSRPMVATGTGVCDFAWVSDDDVFALLHAPDLLEHAIAQVPRKQTNEGEAVGSNMMSPNLKMIGAGALNVANLATSVTKGATGMTVGVTTKAIRSGAKGVTKGVKKSLGLFGKKKKSGNGAADGEGSILSADDDDDESSTATGQSASITLPSAADLEALHTPIAKVTTSIRRVELKRLEVLETQSSTELSGGMPAATCIGLGDVTLRGGGSRNPPTGVFGGPVLCVASRSKDDKDGHAFFYTKKFGENDSHKATSYQSSGPSLPYPDLVEWDDDGRLCAVVVSNRVAVYLLEEHAFVLLGTVRIRSPSMPNDKISSVKFVHGALYCCTWNSVHCTLLGSLEGGICRMDSYMLASTTTFMINESQSSADLTKTATYTSFTPSPIALPLVQPTVLGYQRGSLILSSLRGVYAIPLDCPLLRIGLFLASGQIERASRWFDAVPNSDHEMLANFLERRGHPKLAQDLPGLSLETNIDICMRYGLIDRLEDTIEMFGVAGLRAIDMGRGVHSNPSRPDPTAHSIVVCVGAYLLSHGRVELTRRLASECLHAGEEGRKDAFTLGALLFQINKSDSTKLIQRSISGNEPPTEDWMIGKFAREYIL